MAKIPDVTALGGLPTPQSAGAPSVRVGYNPGVGEAVMQLGDALQRIQSRDDGISRIRAINAFKQQAQDTYDRVSMEGDWADPQSVDQFGVKLREAQSKILGSYSGSNRHAVEADLEDLIGDYTRSAVSSRLEGQRKAASDLIGQELNQLENLVYANPALVENYIRIGKARARKSYGLLQPEEERKMEDGIPSRLWMAAFRGMLSKGQVNEVERVLLEDEEVSSVLGEQQQRYLWEQISAFYAEQRQAKVTQLSPAESKALGLPAGTLAERHPDGSLTIVYQPEKSLERLRAEAAARVEGESSAIQPYRTLEDDEKEALGFGRGTVVQEAPDGQLHVVGTGDQPRPLLPHNYIFPDGTTRAYRTDDPELDSALKAGAVRAGFDVQSSDVSGLGLGKKETADTAARVTNSAHSLSQLSSILKDIKRLGTGVVGVRGKVGRTVGGLAGQISEDLGREVTKGITNVTPEQLSAFQAQARQIIAGRIELMSGEESGRYSEKERYEASQALRVLETEASLPQIVGALEAVTMLEIVAIERDRLKLGRVPPGLDDEQIEDLGDRIKQRYGLSDDIVLQALARLKALHTEFGNIK